jgi:hypothetical protein
MQSPRHYALGDAGKSDTAPRFIGTWRLVSIDDPARGPHPIGVLMYDARGHMAVQVIPDTARPKFSGTIPTPEEAQAALTGYTAYFGTYTIDEAAGTVTHHCAGNVDSGRVGNIVRRYQFEGDGRLILMPLESPVRIVWERIK